MAFKPKKPRLSLPTNDRHILLTRDMAAADDPHFRYHIPRVELVYQGRNARGNVAESVWDNLDDIAKELKVPPQVIIKNVKGRLATQGKYHRSKGKLKGKHTREEVEAALMAFIITFPLLCPAPECGKPELKFEKAKPKQKKKQKQKRRWKCRACGYSSAGGRAHGKKPVKSRKPVAPSHDDDSDEDDAPQFVDVLAEARRSLREAAASPAAQDGGLMAVLAEKARLLCLAYGLTQRQKAGLLLEFLPWSSEDIEAINKAVTKYAPVLRGLGAPLLQALDVLLANYEFMFKSARVSQLLVCLEEEEVVDKQCILEYDRLSASRRFHLGAAICVKYLKAESDDEETAEDESDESGEQQ